MGAGVGEREWPVGIVRPLVLERLVLLVSWLELPWLRAWVGRWSMNEWVKGGLT